MTDAHRDALAALAVAGANVQPGQVVAVACQPGREPLVRAIAAAAYRRGARFVDVSWHDPHVKLARMRHAADDTLDWVPPWYARRAEGLRELGAAIINLSGPVAPGLMDGIDGARLGRDRLPAVREMGELAVRGEVNWTVVPCPTAEWAALVYPDLPGEAALRRLWGDVAHVCRLDAPDPAAAWMARARELEASAARLTARRLSAVRFVGDGTDLTVGLLPSSRWLGGSERRRPDGLVFLPNVPTEEVFTTPDPERTEGVVRATLPLDVGGTVVRGLRVRFAAGRAVEITADSGQDVLRGRAATDAGAARLGEVALVDGSGRIGPLGTVFFDTLLDENAASHIALGASYAAAVGEEDRARVNTSDVHLDFMIGGPGVTVFGVDAQGRETVLLRDGRWADPG